MPIEQTCSVSSTNRYITTAIPYVNAAPHIGFALEVVQADTLARLYRLQGYNVRLQTGTDENSIKNVQAAEAAGLPVAELVERNAARFVALKMNASTFPTTTSSGPASTYATSVASSGFGRHASRGAISTSAPIAASTAPVASSSTRLASSTKDAAPSTARSRN